MSLSLFEAARVARPVGRAPATLCSRDAGFAHLQRGVLLMAGAARTPIMALALRYLSRLRFPALFALAAALLAVNLVFPDPVPMLDELLLATLTVALGTWRKRGQPESDEQPPAAPEG